jgi:hypothetical protein
MDTNQIARQQAQAEHQHGTGQSNTSSWDHDSRRVYEVESEYLKKIAEKKTT